MSILYMYLTCGSVVIELHVRRLVHKRKFEQEPSLNQNTYLTYETLPGSWIYNIYSGSSMFRVV